MPNVSLSNQGANPVNGLASELSVVLRLDMEILSKN
jgi:hypothetical protein